jgi:hypothetical protein
VGGLGLGEQRPDPLHDLGVGHPARRRPGSRPGGRAVGRTRRP